jgi:exodeoxyribonuclease VII large subunit
MLRPAQAPRILGVSELAALLRDTLESEVGAVWVAGELSNFRRQPSGHCYFTLKDEQSQLAAVMFRSVAQTLPFRPGDGMEVVVHARVSLYPQRGALQLYVDTMEPRGLGALQLAFEQLKRRLAAEGLFAPERKRPLPRWPGSVGVVTALGGAALHDMRVVLARRWPLARVVVRPVRVQGAGAAREIAEGLADLATSGAVDVVIVGRGGGSLEDLWAFNEEVVARAIAASPVPVVSAVGHEIDVTIADFVADARAPTPTAAAALVVPDRDEVAAAVARADAALRAALARRVGATRQAVARLEDALRHPERRFADLGQRIDDLGGRARQALVRRVGWERRAAVTLAQRLARSGPAARVAASSARVVDAGRRLRFAVGVEVGRARAAMAQTVRHLEALSPLACLARGYAVVRHGGAGGGVVRDAAALGPGDPISVRFARGRAHARVERTEPGDG